MRHAMNVFALACAVGLATLAACDGKPPAGGALAAPVFVDLQTADKNGAWIATTSLTPAPKVLPARGRGVRIAFTAPVGSTFAVALHSPSNSAPIPLVENTGTPAPPDDGYFQVISVDTSKSPPVYHMYVRAPTAIADPVNYSIDIVNKSLRTDVTDSPPLTVDLHQRPIFTVTVMVTGAGHVTSNPAGINCGRGQGGSQLSPCTFDFPAGPVQLLPGSNPGAKFIGWTGNCAPGVQVCTFALSGTAGITTTAVFGASGSTATASTCQAAPALTGLRWIDIPDCATGNIAGHPGIDHPARCDAQGFFCCEPGPSGSNAPRCGGIGKIESPPDCMRNAPRGMLRQPGGCYEVDTP